MGILNKNERVQALLDSITLEQAQEWAASSEQWTYVVDIAADFDLIATNYVVNRVEYHMQKMLDQAK